MCVNSLVSVIIPTYKRSDTLPRAIQSVLNQTYRDIEIIVVDDNNPESHDRALTEKAMSSFFSNEKIKYVKHDTNRNGSAARNTGFMHSNGEFIMFLDDDDEFLPNKVQLQIDKLKSLDDSWGICYTKYVRKRKDKLIDKGIDNKEGFIGIELLKGSIFLSAGSNLMIRRDVVKAINGFNEKFLRRQDLEFLIRASQISKAAHVPQICLVINKDDRSNMLNGNKLQENSRQFLDAFSEYIEKLTEDEKRQVIIAQNLPIIRYYLQTRQIKKVYTECRNVDISWALLVRYICYLFTRKMFKLCYGFKI